MLLYTLGLLRNKYRAKKFLSTHAEEFGSCDSVELHDCNLQLSMVLPRSDFEILDRIQGLLQSCLNHNFDTMRAELHHVDEEWSVISYSLSGEGPANGLALYGDFENIVSQERIPYHLIAVKRLGDASNPFAYSTLKEVNKLGSFE